MRCPDDLRTLRAAGAAASLRFAGISAGYAEGSADVTACRLLRKASIRDEIESLRRAVLTKLELDGEALVADVIAIKRAATLDGEHMAALKAAELLGRALGAAGLGNPFAAKSVKLRRSTDKADAASADLAREVALLINRNTQ